MKLRESLWDFIWRNRHPGEILPSWGLYIRWILFPIDTFYWKYSTGEGYQWERDIWIIGGNIFSTSMLKQLGNCVGNTFKILKNENGIIYLEKVDPKDERR